MSGKPNVKDWFILKILQYCLQINRKKAQKKSHIDGILKSGASEVTSA